MRDLSKTGENPASNHNPLKSSETTTTLYAVGVTPLTTVHKY
jgi:hypothetical protein